jgi:hypothetical protein
MRAAIWGLFVVALASCASTPDEPEEDKRPPGGPGRASAEELREYLDNVQPEAVPVVRYREPLRWKALNYYFAIMETRDGPHLVELSWECKELGSNRIYGDMVDRREKRGILRANIDTLRGCRIKNFYKLPEVKAAEVADDDAPD